MMYGAIPKEECTANIDALDSRARTWATQKSHQRIASVTFTPDDLEDIEEIRGGQHRLPSMVIDME
jgi:hypothetical protein